MKKLIRLFIFAFALQSCENNTGKTTESYSKSEISTEKNIIPTDFKSPLRPNEKLELGKIYTDTVKFIDFDDNGDNWLFIVKKDKQNAITLIKNSDNEYDFVRGDEIEIRWKMDSIRYAGDTEFLNFRELMISAKTIKANNKRDFSKMKNQSFVISCGTGCALVHNVKDIKQLNTSSIKVTFEVEMYVDEELSKTIDVVYIFYYDNTNKLNKVISEADNENVLETYGGGALESFTNFGSLLIE
ncbi:hypothetical protein EIH07_07670 [Chryseobacterium taklimakanense]|uniref:hypothetical protein n=1 Tax=Chryseobacterium taklimakanense TaxID=536441 RepID=UPI000F5FF0F8|nr:hypothetical protein [Chryseobacterium taklimakanense]AZI22922.1 hypothetical protein EIH07_07670 [Chryseobacterium taklimakanense]